MKLSFLKKGSLQRNLIIHNKREIYELEFDKNTTGSLQLNEDAYVSCEFMQKNKKFLYIKKNDVTRNWRPTNKDRIMLENKWCFAREKTLEFGFTTLKINFEKNPSYIFSNFLKINISSWSVLKFWRGVGKRDLELQTQWMYKNAF